MFDSDLLWPFSALPPCFHRHAYVTVSEEFCLLLPANLKKTFVGLCLHTQKHHLFLGFFLSLSIMFRAPEHGEGLGRPRQETTELAGYSEADSRAEDQALYAGLCNPASPRAEGTGA